jgi:hypothetical protein
MTRFLSFRVTVVQSSEEDIARFVRDMKAHKSYQGNVDHGRNPPMVRLSCAEWHFEFVESGISNLKSEISWPD